MEAIGCLVPKSWSELHCRHGMQLFKKHDVFMLLHILNLNLSIYYIVLRKIDMFLKKKQLKIQQRQLGKMVILKAGAYIVSVRGEKEELKHALRNCTPLAQGTIEPSVNNGFST